MEYADSEHVFIGFRQDDPARLGDPLLVPRAILNEHVYFAGQTGGAKTALGIILLLVQLARPYLAPARDPLGRVVRDGYGRPAFRAAREPRPPIVILDMKGDAALFNTARIIAAANGHPFRFFSIDPGRPSHYFDPFQNLQPKAPIFLAELFLQALNLFHGEDYGASFFTRQHRRVLLTAMEEFEKGKRSIDSWQQLYEGAKQLKGRLNRDATELLSVLHAMTFYPQMRAAGRAQTSANVIHMPTVLEERQLVYFWLPSGTTSLSVREIGKLALYSLFDAAERRTAAGNRVQTYVFIDEFHRIAGENLEAILTMSRGFGLSLVMANQDPKALRLKNFDLRSTVYNNTRYKQFFTVTDADEIRDLMTISGEKTEWLEATSEATQLDAFGYVRGYSISRSKRESKVPRLSADTPRLVSDDQESSLVWITRGGGYADLQGVPTWVKSAWPIAYDEYQRRADFSKLPWPAVEEDAPKEDPGDGGGPASRTAEGEKSAATQSTEYEQNVAMMERLLAAAVGTGSGAAPAVKSAPAPEDGDAAKKPKRAKKEPPPSRVKRTAARKAKREKKEPPPEKH